MPALAEQIIQRRRHEQELRGYATSSRWYTGLSNAISFLERAEAAQDAKERFFEAWLSVYNLLMMHGSVGDDEFKRFNRWVTSLMDVPRVRELIQEAGTARFRDAVKKAAKAVLFDTEKKKWREGYQQLEIWNKAAISPEKAIRYFLIIIRDIRNACAHAEFNPSSAATKKALNAAADSLIPISAAAIQATIDHPAEGTTGRTTAYRSVLYPYIRNSDSVFSDYYLERLLPDEELGIFTDDDSKTKLKELAKQFESHRAALASAEAGETKRRWCEPVLFQALGIDARAEVRIVAEKEVFEPDYVLTHADTSKELSGEYQGKDAGKQLACLVWVLPWRQELDALQTNGDGDVLPMELAQRALAASDVQWGVVTNGQRLRLLHKSTAHKPRSFLELDLRAVIDRRGDAEALFAFRYCLGLFSGSSFTEKDDHRRTRLDRALMESERHGKEISDELKKNVYQALEELGEGFLAYLRSNHDVLKAWREKREFSGSLDAFLHSDELLTDIYHESLSLMYRLLFLFYAESRNLLPMENEMYRDSYSLESIRDDIIAVQDDPDPKRFFSKGDTQLWDRLRELFGFVNTGWGDIIPAYNGGLFDPEQHEFLERVKVGDHYLARAIDLLSRTRPRSGQQRGEGRKKITYRDLEIRHLGSIYEGILEYSALIADEDKVVIRRGAGSNAAEEYVSVWQLSKDEKEQLKGWQEAIDENPDSPRLPHGCKITGFKKKGRYFLVFGGRESKRKSSGSYYTPDYIVQYIVEKTLGPLVRGENREGYLRDVPLTSDEILELKVLDPAMGSGHFLVAATEYLARAYGEALIREGKDTDHFMSDQEFVRYKRLVAERSIYGVDLNPMAMELAKLSMWLFTMDRGRPLSFLDHHMKRGNSLIGTWIEELGRPPEINKTGKPKKQSPSINLNLFEVRFRERVPMMVRDLFGIMTQETLTSKDIQIKKALDQTVRSLKEPFKNLADLFIGTYFGEEYPDYNSLLLDVEQTRNRWSPAARDLAAFHWELEFPEVWFDAAGNYLTHGGFNALIGNPPWGAAFTPAELSYHRHTNRAIIVRMIDAFMYFLYQGTNKLKNGGILGMILPDSFLYQTDNEKLRLFIVESFRLRSVVNVGNVFEGVTRPACVVVFEKNVPSQNALKVADVSGLDNSLKEVKLSTGLDMEDLQQDSVFDIPRAVLVTSRPARYAIWAKAKKTRSRMLEEFIDEDGIQRGVSPDLKRAFIVSGDEVRRFRLEVQNLRPVLTGGTQVNRYSTNRQDLHLIYTTRKDDFARLPKICAYIDQFRQDITCVEVKEQKHPVYSLHRPRNERIFLKKSKIIGVITEDRIVAALDTAKAFVTDGLYLFSVREGTNDKYLLGILNSKLMVFLYRLIALEEGRVLAQVKPTILASLPIRDIDFADSNDTSLHDRLVKHVEQILMLHDRLVAATSEPKVAEIQRRIVFTDQEIDSLVYELYGLNNAEIAVVEGQVHHRS